MKDAHYVLIFVAIGLGLAYVVAKPLRRPPEMAPRVGTPLRPEDQRTVSDASPSVYAEGTIDLAKNISHEDAHRRTLFIIGRASMEGKPAGGPPIAVKKITDPHFPVTFSLTNADNMVGTDYYHEDMVLVARLDADGTAGPKQPDDIETSVPIKAGDSRRVQLILTK